jgi:hypothetical protein
LRSAYVPPHLLVARAAKALLLGTFADRTTDVRRALVPECEVVDLIEQAHRDTRCEEAHAAKRARQRTARLSRLCAETAS